MLKKIFDYILFGLDKVLMCFAYMFEGIGWFFRTCCEGISKGFVFLGSYVNLFYEKCILFVWKKIVSLYKKIKAWFINILNKISHKREELREKNKDSKFFNGVKKVFGFVPNYLANNISYRKKQALWGFVFVLPLMIGFIYFFLFPFINTIIYSFCNVYNASANKYNGKIYGSVTEFVGFDNYKYIWNVHATFKDTLVDVFFNTLLQVVLILIFSLIIAVVLNSKFKCRAFVRAVFFMPVIFNSQAVDIAVSKGSSMSTIMDESGQDVFSTVFDFSEFLISANVPKTAVDFLTKTCDSIFDVISYSGVQILIFLSGIQSVSKSLYEAAKIEGATQYEIFWKITFPMVSPLMLTAGIYTVVDSFLRSDLLKLMSKYGSSGDVAYTLGLGGLTNDGIYAAMSILFCLVSLAVVAIVTLVLRKVVFYQND